MASVVNRDQLKHTLSGKKKKKARNVLCTPYFHKNTGLSKSHETEILGRLENLLLRFSNVKLNIFKTFACCGLNEISRIIEKDQAKLVLIDKTSNMIRSHLIQLCATRNCKSITLSNLESSVVCRLSLTRASCLAFKTEVGALSAASSRLKSAVDDFINHCCSFATSEKLPWINTEEHRTSEDDQSCAVSSKTEESEESDGNSGENRKSADFSHFYVYKQQSKDAVEDCSSTVASFGDDFISFSKVDEDEFEEHVTRSGRVKLFAKSAASQATSDTVKTTGNKRKRKQSVTASQQVLGMNEEKSQSGTKLKKKKKVDSGRFFLDATSETSSNSVFQTPNVARQKPNEKRKKKQKKTQ